MLIISNFNDYYDKVLVNGVDKEVVYNRTQKGIEDQYEINDFEFRDIIGTQIAEEDVFRVGYFLEYYTELFLIAGRLYVMFKLEFDDGYESRDNFLIRKVRSEYFVDSEEWLNAFIEHKKELKTPWYMKNRDKKDLPYIKRLARIAQRLDGHDCSQYMAERKLIVARIILNRRTKYIEKHPILKDYGFGKKVDSYTIFQMIYNWVSMFNVEIKTAKIPDKYKIEAKGFDKKYGFRKRP